MADSEKMTYGKKFYNVAICDKCGDVAQSEMPFISDTFPCPCGGTFGNARRVDERELKALWDNASLG